jgi:hypothetical protein
MNPAMLLQTLLPLIGGLMSRRGPTQGERRDQNTVEQMLQGAKGQGGEFADLFGSDYDAFQKSFIDPAMSNFRNVTAPGIQQEFISQGQQRGTGLDDTLTRAGVDMQSNLNRDFANFQEQGLNRRFNALKGSFGQGQGAPPQGGFGQAVGGALQGSQSNALIAELTKLIQGIGK